MPKADMCECDPDRLFVLGTYGMTIDQMRKWGEQVGNYSPGETARDLRFIDYPSRIAGDN